MRIIGFVIGVMCLTIGCLWVYVFGFTDYRPAQRAVGLPTGIGAAVIGVGLIAWAMRHWWRQRSE